MSQPDNDPYKQFWVLGIAMMIPIALVGGPLAGYLLWRFVGVRYLGLSSAWTLPFIALGLVASGLHIAGLIKRVQDSDSQKKI